MQPGDTRLLSYLPRQSGSLLECKQDNHARVKVVPHTHTHLQRVRHTQQELTAMSPVCRVCCAFVYQEVISKVQPTHVQLSLCLSVCLPSLFACHYCCLFLHVNNPSVKPLKLCQSHAVVGPFSLVSPSFESKK